MAAHTPSSVLASRVQGLLEERQQHETAIGRIDETLAAISSALTGSILTRARTTAGKPAKRSRRRRRGTFAMTGDESTLSFVAQNKNPTSHEIEQHWKGEGRGGHAAKTLGKLVQEKKLKRTPIKGQRGNRYSIA